MVSKWHDMFFVHPQWSWLKGKAAGKPKCGAPQFFISIYLDPWTLALVKQWIFHGTHQKLSCLQRGQQQPSPPTPNTHFFKGMFGRKQWFPMVNTDPFFSRGSTNHTKKRHQVFGVGVWVCPFFRSPPNMVVSLLVFPKIPTKRRHRVVGGY